MTPEYMLIIFLKKAELFIPDSSQNKKELSYPRGSFYVFLMLIMNTWPITLNWLYLK